MLKRMYAVADRNRMDTACTDLTHDPSLLESAALIVLSAAWAEESERDQLRAVLAETKGKLPVIAVAIIATACMYGMYLLATGGKKKVTKTTIRKPGGSYESREMIDYADPARPLGAIANIFRHSELRVDEQRETYKQN